MVNNVNLANIVNFTSNLIVVYIYIITSSYLHFTEKIRIIANNKKIRDKTQFYYNFSQPLGSNIYLSFSSNGDSGGVHISTHVIDLLS